MNVRFNLEGTSRKALAQAISEILGEKAEYTGTFRFAYIIGHFVVEKDGTLAFDDMTDSEEVENVLEGLAQRGFEIIPAGNAENEETEGKEKTMEETETPESSTETTKAKAEEPAGLTISLPVSMVNLQNLTNLLDAKGDLIKKSLGVERLPLELRGDTLSFPWFPVRPDSETCQAVTRLVSALCKLSRESKRISRRKHEVPNEKYAFRCFLLRLGFIGAEYKTDRKILLRNMEGNSAFKSGKKEEGSDAVSQ